jgi:hypothetical protein
MKLFVVAALLAVAGSVAAAILVEREATIYSLDDATYATEAECLAAARAGLGAAPRVCEIASRLVVTGNCSDVPMPALVSEARAVRLSDIDWRTDVNRYVPAPYPNCWAVEWVPLTYSGTADTPQRHEPVPETRTN